MISLNRHSWTGVIGTLALVTAAAYLLWLPASSTSEARAIGTDGLSLPAIVDPNTLVPRLDTSVINTVVSTILPQSSAGGTGSGPVAPAVQDAPVIPASTTPISSTTPVPYSGSSQAASAPTVGQPGNNAPAQTADTTTPTEPTHATNAPTTANNAATPRPTMHINTGSTDYSEPALGTETAPTVTEATTKTTNTIDSNNQPSQTSADKTQRNLSIKHVLLKVAAMIVGVAIIYEALGIIRSRQHSDTTIEETNEPDELEQIKTLSLQALPTNPLNHVWAPSDKPLAGKLVPPLKLIAPGHFGRNDNLRIEKYTVIPRKMYEDNGYQPARQNYASTAKARQAYSRG